MYISRLPAITLVLSLLGSQIIAAPAPKDVNPADPKPAIVLPKAPDAVVLSYDPGAGGFIRKGAAPYLKIQADGRVFVTNLHDGSKKESKLTAKQLDELLRFVVQKNDFFGLTETKIADAIKTAAGKGPFIAVGGAGTSEINLQVNGKKHQVRFRAAEVYSRAYPKAKVVPQFVAVEKRLSTLAWTVEKGK